MLGSGSPLPAYSPKEASAWPSSFAFRKPTALGMAFPLLVPEALGIALSEA